MLEIAMPKIEVVQAAENYGRFKIEPLDPGYGHTLGNALRRVLISSIPGSAVTKIKLEGVYHEFSTVRGIREDVTEIVLNVKGIRLRSWADRPVKIQLLKRGAGVVRAGDIETPSNVQIVNPNHYLCTIDDEDAVLEMDLDAGRAWTSESAQWQQDGLTVQAGGFDYRQDVSLLDLKPPIRARLVTTSAVRR